MNGWPVPWRGTEEGMNARLLVGACYGLHGGLDPSRSLRRVQTRDHNNRSMSRKVYVVGVGMTKFEKPGSRTWQYPDMVQESVSKALEDAGITYDQIEQACVGYVYGAKLLSYSLLIRIGETTAGQKALYSVGLSGIPIYNMNNNCSTGSTALFSPAGKNCFILIEFSRETTNSRRFGRMCSRSWLRTNEAWITWKYF